MGSNLGNRDAHLREAVGRLFSIHEPSAPFLVSQFLETAPIDCADGDPPFLNAVVDLECSLAPDAVLELLQKWEAGMGRPADHGFHTPRTIDLDILYYGALKIETSRLSIPHPGLATRDFVKIPLLSIRPDFFAPNPEGATPEPGL